MNDVITSYNNEKPDLSDMPSLSKSAKLVLLNISCWTARKKDRGVTEEVAINKSADTQAVSVNKNLMSTSVELTELKKHVALWRKAHARLTGPWMGTGYCFIPNAAWMMKYQKEMSTFSNKYDSLLAAFLSKYEQDRITSMAAQGNMADLSDYPDAMTLRNKFGWSLTYHPVSDAGDSFLDDLEDDQRAYMEEQLGDTMQGQHDKFIQSALEGMVNNIWTRLYDNLKTLSSNLSVKEDGTPSKMYDSVFNTTVELVNMMREFNVTGNPQLDAMRQELESALAGVSVEGIKHNITLREVTKGKVDSVKSKIEALPSLDL